MLFSGALLLIIDFADDRVFLISQRMLRTNCLALSRCRDEEIMFRLRQICTFFFDTLSSLISRKKNYSVFVGCNLSTITDRLPFIHTRFILQIDLFFALFATKISSYQLFAFLAHLIFL